MTGTTPNILKLTEPGFGESSVEDAKTFGRRLTFKFEYLPDYAYHDKQQRKFIPDLESIKTLDGFGQSWTMAGVLHYGIGTFPP